MESRNRMGGALRQMCWWYVGLAIVLGAEATVTTREGEMALDSEKRKRAQTRWAADLKRMTENPLVLGQRNRPSFISRFRLSRQRIVVRPCSSVDSVPGVTVKFLSGRDDT